MGPDVVVKDKRSIGDIGKVRQHQAIRPCQQQSLIPKNHALLLEDIVPPMTPDVAREQSIFCMQALGEADVMLGKMSLEMTYITEVPIEDDGRDQEYETGNSKEYTAVCQGALKVARAFAAAPLCPTVRDIFVVGVEAKHRCEWMPCCCLPGMLWHASTF